MIPPRSLAWGRTNNCIRELAAFGSARKAEIGEENVFDFSIGNPSIPAPDCVHEIMKELIDTMDSVELHSYAPAPGLMSFREKIAEDLRSRFNAPVRAEMVYVCSGASTGLVGCTCGLMNEDDEAIVFAPFFSEYSVYIEQAGGNTVVIPPMPDFQPDMDAFTAAISEKTKLVIINTPNNPSGVVLSAESLATIGSILSAAQEKYAHPIYLVSDEPYRDLVYDDIEVPCVMHYYNNTIICYSFSKSLSLPGERIGYLAVSDKMAGREDVFAALCGGIRGCGYICASSMMQRVVERCIDKTADISKYKLNRDLLYNGLTELGFECAKPDGAFYLFMKSPIADAKEFSEHAKKYELLLVPSDDFGVTGYLRLAYCVDERVITAAMPAFKKLAEDFF